MKRIRYLTILFLIYFTILFNLDRISSIGGISYSHLDYFIFLLIPIISIAIIGVPLLRCMKIANLFIFGIIIFLIISITDYTILSHTLGNIYLLFTEFVLYLISIYLCYQYNQNFSDLEKSIENVILPKHGHRVYDDKDMARRIIEHEFIRGRRYNHPISAIVVEPNQHSFEDEAIVKQALQEIQQSLRGHYLLNKLMNILERETRLTDLVVEWDRQGRFVIICPETTADSTSKLIDRLNKAVQEEMGIILSFGIASFPNDARTFDAVLEKAESHLSSPIDLLLQLSELANKKYIQ